MKTNIRVIQISAENFAEVVKEEKRKVFKDIIRREVKLGYYAKVNSRSIIIGTDYVATICPLC